MCVSILTSVVCGIIIGLEREHRDKPAGIKTLALICLGSTIFTIISIMISSDYPSDRARIAAQVVTGIGFLGAGAIIRDGSTIVGLTTGATIWTTAAIGMLIGIGHPVYGVIISVAIVLLLTALRKIEKYLGR